MFQDRSTNSPIHEKAWLQVKGIIKWKLVFLTIINARLHTVIAKGYKDISKYVDPQLEACIFFVNQEHALEVVIK